MVSFQRHSVFRVKVFNCLFYSLHLSSTPIVREDKEKEKEKGSERESKEVGVHCVQRYPPVLEQFTRQTETKGHVHCSIGVMGETREPGRAAEGEGSQGKGGSPVKKGGGLHPHLYNTLMGYTTPRARREVARA